MYLVFEEVVSSALMTGLSPDAEFNEEGCRELSRVLVLVFLVKVLFFC